MLDRMIQAIQSASEFPARPDPGLTGFSGGRLIAALGNLSRLFEDDPTAAYVEVGVFRGLTLCSVAAAAPRLSCFGIDNFAFFDREGTNRRAVAAAIASRSLGNAFLVDKDYEVAFESMAEVLRGKRIAVYFVDGPHDYRSQLMCLMLARPFLHEDAVIVVDDSNYEHVRQANADFLRIDGRFRLLFEAYTPSHPSNMAPAELAEAREGWWNGVNILTSTAGELAFGLPPSRVSRELFENEHYVHAARAAELAPVAVALAGDFVSANPFRILRGLARLTWNALRQRSRFRGRQTEMNTFSHELPRQRWNSAVSART